jgi:hypothetical protein
MPRYSGDQIYQGNPTVSPTALNYRKSDASSNFGTRKLAFYTVWFHPDLGIAAHYAENNSVFYQIIRAIQQGSGLGGTIGPSEDSGQIRGGGGGGAELFYVGTPQNSSTSALNQLDNWYGLKPTNNTNDVYVASASGDGTTATLTFTSPVIPAPFNVGDAIQVINVGTDYNCALRDGHFVTECTTTYVKYNSTATATLTDLEARCFADLGLDCFTFGVVDDAEPFLPDLSGHVGDTDFSGVAGDVVYYCGSIFNTGRSLPCVSPLNFDAAIRQVLLDNELSTADVLIFRLQESFGLLPF